MTGGELNAEANRGDLLGCSQLEPNVMEVGPLEEITEVISDEDVEELRPKLLPELKSLGGRPSFTRPINSWGCKGPLY